MELVDLLVQKLVELGQNSEEIHQEMDKHWGYLGI
jgi:hypothetical protein